LQIYFGLEFKVGPKKAVFAPSPWAVNAWGSLDQIFQIALMSEYIRTYICRSFVIPRQLFVMSYVDTKFKDYSLNHSMNMNENPKCKNGGDLEWLGHWFF